jgi:hypothetical protein
MQTFPNTFTGGLDTNTSRNLIENNKYVEANNVNIASINNFFALENIKGTTMVQDIAFQSDTEIIGVFATKYKVGTVYDKDCLTIFGVSDLGASSRFKIWAYDTEADALYLLYTETFDGTDYFTSDRIIDAYLYPETGIDILYFTDNYNQLRKLRCEIPVSYSDNFLTTMDLRLLKHGGNGSIALDSIATGGSLFCGSYQFAYQLVNPTTNEYTKFSLLTNPIHVYLTANSIVQSGVGLQSNQQILLDITPSSEELSHYTHFRLAVIEQIEPLGVEVSKAFLTPVELISTYLSGSVLQNYPFKANIRLETIDVAELVVDTLAIETVKTLSVRQNRLIAGNIAYKDLSYDLGTPAITGGSIVKQRDTSYDNPFVKADFSSRYRGYFRDEVYRFAISYFDEDGNFSYPKVLDMSLVTHNQSTLVDGIKDMKFPRRDQYLNSTNYTLFYNGSSLQSLGLQLNNITNHPTWARGFVILRAPRIKNIQFQTPMIPMNEVYGVGAVEKYPTDVNELSGTDKKSVQYADAQPMGPFNTVIPRNYFWVNANDIELFSTSGGSTGSGLAGKRTGEAQLVQNPTYNFMMVFPPDFLYENKTFDFNPSFTSKTVDAALVKGIYTDYSNISVGSTTLGRNIKTSIAGTFYACRDNQYYYDSTHTGGKFSIGSSALGLTAYDQFNNFDIGGVVGGNDVLRYDKLETASLTWGNKANIQKCGILKLNGARSELNYTSSLTFAAGSQIAKPSNVSQAFYTTAGTYIHTIEIANIVANLSDARYGKKDTPYDYISTGTIYTFTDVDLTSVRAGASLPKSVTVWGGDCYTVPHLFKITDTTYGITSSEKSETGGTPQGPTQVARSWEKSYQSDDGATVLGIPVAYKNAAQYIQIVLESEYNPSVIDREIVAQRTTDGVLSNKMTVFGLDSSAESSCRVPLTYNINPSHKKGNTKKVFQVKDPLLNVIDNLGARLIYSDQKVYQSSIVGFDTFRVLNYYDLDEKYGDIHKLALAGESMYALQERAVSYIGIGERSLETNDGLTLSIQSGSIIGTVLHLDTNKGTQHLQSVKETGDAVYFVDNRNQTINRIAGQKIDVISEQSVASTFRSVLGTKIAETDIVTVYDPILKQLLFITKGNSSTGTCYVFDEARGIWVSNYQFPSMVYGGGYGNQKLYTVGVDVTSGLNIIGVGAMYQNSIRGYLYGALKVPNVKVIVNPDPQVGKVFHDVLIVSSDKLDNFDILVERDTTLGNQTGSGISLDITSRGEGNYRAKILRDTNGARFRGPFAQIDFKWKSGETIPRTLLSSINTKYAPSENRF